MNDVNPLLPGLGFGIIAIILVLYLALIALMLWLGYLIMRTAVKNGVLLPMRQSGTGFPPAGPSPYTPPSPSADWTPPPA